MGCSPGLSPEWRGDTPVLCIAGRTPLDEAAAIMLAQLCNVPGPQIKRQQQARAFRIQGHLPVQKRQEEGGGTVTVLALKIDNDAVILLRPLCHVSSRISASVPFDELHLDDDSLLKQI